MYDTIKHCFYQVAITIFFAIYFYKPKLYNNNRNKVRNMLSRNLKKMREFKGITQAELANVLGITQQAVARWERNKSEPDADTLKRLSKFFKVSIDYLLDNEDNHSPTFNDDEVKLVYDYRNLNGDGRRLLFGIIDSLRLTHAKKESGSRAIVQSNSGGHNFIAAGDGNSYVDSAAM